MAVISSNKALQNAIWAKTNPFESLESHMIRSGDLAKTLLTTGVFAPILKDLSINLNLTTEDTISLICYIVSIHDIGKCHPYFQAKCTTTPGFNDLISEDMVSFDISHETLINFRHERYTYHILKRLFQNIDYQDDDFIVAITKAVAMHHQGKHGDVPNAKIPSQYNPAKWEDLQDYLNEKMLKRYNPPFKKIKDYKNPDVVIYEIMAITIISDWIASDSIASSQFKNINSSNSSFDEIIEQRGLNQLPINFNCNTFNELWPHIPRDGLRGIQEAADKLGENPSKLYIIEAPMGEGKSETALYLAIKQLHKFNRNGFYMALPTSASGNQMYERVNDLFKTHKMNKAKLLHSTAWLLDNHTPDTTPMSENYNEDTLQWLAPLRRGLLSQFAVGTIDQAMLSVMQVYYGVIRLLGISNKVLILDEVHAYDTYMQTINERLLAWCKALGVPVILLSATLPSNKKKSFLTAYGVSTDFIPSSAYPLITSVDEDGTVIETPIDKVSLKHQYKIALHPIANNYSDIADLALEKVKNGGCCAVFLNTVKRAQDLYTVLAPKESDTKIILFHARYPAKTRQNIEKECVELFGKNTENRPKKCILITTQVSEQSLDISFDSLISDMAPIDLLIQRLGREHRFASIPKIKGLSTPMADILTDPNGYRNNYVYAEILMQQTEDFLKKTNAINVPEDMRYCIESIYGAEEPIDAKLYEAWAKNVFDNNFSAAQANSLLIDEPNKEYPTLADKDLNILRSDDEQSNYSAKTRIGDGSQRIVFLPEKEISSLPELIDKETAKTLLGMSVPIRTSRFGDVPDNFIKGTAYLKGTLIIPTRNNTVKWGKYMLTNDKTLGVIITKE